MAFADAVLVHAVPKDTVGAEQAPRGLGPFTANFAEEEPESEDSAGSWMLRLKAPGALSPPASVPGEPSLVVLHCAARRGLPAAVLLLNWGSSVISATHLYMRDIVDSLVSLCMSSRSLVWLRRWRRGPQLDPCSCLISRLQLQPTTRWVRSESPTVARLRAWVRQVFVGSVSTVVSRRALKSGDLAAPVPKSSFAVSHAQALSRYHPVELPAVQVEAARAVKPIFSSTALPVMIIPDARGRGFEVPKQRLLTLRLRVICHFERCGRKTFMQLLARLSTRIFPCL